MSTLRNVCVYCGSSPGNNPEFITAARQFGEILAARGINLVYGGGSFGLMGAVANAVLDNGGTVTGVIPKSLVDRERALNRVQEMVVTADMHERKRIMFERSDAFVALPGGLGTLEELVEQLTWVQLVHHKKPVVLLSIDRFWSPLTALFKEMSASGFIYNAPVLDDLICEETAQVVPMLERKLAVTA